MILYAVVPVDQVTQAQLNLANIRDMEELRQSVDGTLCVLKFSDEDRTVFVEHQWYTKAQIDLIMATEEWNDAQ
jgi:hypothetical protein